MKKANIEQLDIFATFFSEEAAQEVPMAAEESKAPRIGVTGVDKKPSNQCGENSCSNEEESDDLPNFADLEQGIENEDSEKTTETPNKEKEKKFEDINTPWLICYAGHKIPFHKPGTPIEKVRQMLEKDFPELTKQRTQMTFDEKKQIVIPVITGAKKGAFTC